MTCALRMAAGGALEFVFVLEDKCDPAHAVIAALMAEAKGQGGSGGGGQQRSVRIQFAGCAQRTSQKIHK